MFVDADNVLRLEIEMYDVVEGEVFAALAELRHDSEDVLLGKLSLVQDARVVTGLDVNDVGGIVAATRA